MLCHSERLKGKGSSNQTGGRANECSCVCTRRGRDLHVVLYDTSLPHSYPLWGGGEWWRNSDDVTVMSCSLSLFPRARTPHPLPVTEQFYLCSLASAHVCENVHVLNCLACAVCMPVSMVLIGVPGLESERAGRRLSIRLIWHCGEAKSERIRKMMEVARGCLGKRRE